jgi:pantetheine-phosphate adenylyltransferase
MWNNLNYNELFCLTFADVIKKYVPLPIDNILKRWREPHRFFHNVSHLNAVLTGLTLQKDKVKSDEEWDALVLAAFFHDIYYFPGDKLNEINSTKIMLDYFVDFKLKDSPVVKLAEKIILDTAEISENKTGVFDIFQTADCWGLIYYRFEDILPYENAIFKEFQKYSVVDYKKGRVDFLKKAARIFNRNELTLINLARYVATKVHKVGIYAGSFNPFHKGHLNILEQSEKIFDKVVILYGHNPDKKNRIPSIPQTISNRECVIYTGLLPEFLKKYEEMGCEVTLIRGLRNEYDLNYEQNLVSFVKDYMSSVRVVFLLCDKEFEHVSSGAIRSLSTFNANISKYIVL